MAIRDSLKKHHSALPFDGTELGTGYVQQGVKRSALELVEFIEGTNDRIKCYIQECPDTFDDATEMIKHLDQTQRLLHQAYDDVVGFKANLD